MQRDVLFSSNSDRWYTPPHILDLARDILGGIELDPASDEAAQRTVQAARYFTQADDGLSQPWHAASVWLNPPYSGVEPWAERWAGGFTQGEYDRGLFLVPVRCDTAWWQENLAPFPWCAIRARLKFTQGDDAATNSAPFPSALIYAGDDEARFARLASKIGIVYRPALPAPQRAWQGSLFAPVTFRNIQEHARAE